MTNTTHDVTVWQTAPAGSPVEVFCSWAEDSGASNVYNGQHFCPFCGEPMSSDALRLAVVIK